MKRTLCLLSVLLCVAAGAAADVLPESEVAIEALTLVRTVGSYTREHPEAAGAFPAWAPSAMPAAAEPVLVHSYPEFEPTYYLIRIESTPPAFITLDPRDGSWHAYGELPAGDFPVVSRIDAAGLFSQELGRSGSTEEIRAVEMNDRRLYWHLEATIDGRAAEFLAPLDGPAEVHRGTDDLPRHVPRRHSSFDSEPEGQETNETGTRGDPDRWGNTYPGGPPETRGRFPTSYDIPDVPHYYQQTNYFCGPTAVEMVLDYWGPHIPQYDVAHVANTRLAIGGTISTDCARAGHFSLLSAAIQDPELVGYNERPLGYASVDNEWDHADDFPSRYDDLKTLISSDYPIMVLMWFSEAHQARHYRVVKGYDDELDVFIAHDPWYTPPYMGPDVHFDQEFFVDDLWDCGRQRWGLLMAPLEVVVSAPVEVAPAEEFTIAATVIHTAPHPFGGTRSLNNTRATVSLPTGLTFAPGEPSSKLIDGIGVPGTAGTATWQVIAGGLDVDLLIGAFAAGRITGSSSSYPSYVDSLAGAGETMLDIVPDPTTLVLVDCTGAGHCRNIQEGLYIAGHGDTVLVAAGTYTGPLNRELDFHGKQIVLVSEVGYESTVIDCQAEGRAFAFASGELPSTVVDGFSLVNGIPASGFGGAISFTNASSPTIMNCAIVGNSSSFLGGAVYCTETSSPVLNNIVFRDNSSLMGSGLHCKDGAAPTITHCTFAGNSNNQVTCADASPVIANSIIAASVGGAAVTCSGTADPRITRSCIFGNAAGDSLCGDHYENIFADPLFCDLASWELTLHDDSPCLPGNNPWFETIGALGSGGCGTSTGIHEGDAVVAARLRASPNPFRDLTTIEFQTPAEGGRAVVAVYNLKGQKVRTLLDGRPPSGRGILTWNGTDDAGRRVASGVYFCTAALGNETVSHRVVLLR